MISSDGDGALVIIFLILIIFSHFTVQQEYVFLFVYVVYLYRVYDLCTNIQPTNQHAYKTYLSFILVQGKIQLKFSYDYR